MSERDLIFDLTCLQKRSARKKFRRQILDEWGCCAYCGRSKPSTLDHVVPKARGGKTTKENLIAACADCNLIKSDTDWFTWFRAQEFWTPYREEKIFDWVNQSDQIPPFVVSPCYDDADSYMLPAAAWVFTPCLRTYLSQIRFLMMFKSIRKALQG